MKTVVLPSLKALSEFAEAFRSEHPHGAVVALHGELGAGKTAFVRAFVEALSRTEKTRPPPRVTSPTYALHQSYESICPRVEHFDWYRLDKVTESELVEMGYWAAEDAARANNGFVFVEWASRLERDPASFDLVLFNAELWFEVSPQGERRVIVTSPR